MLKVYRRRVSLSGRKFYFLLGLYQLLLLMHCNLHLFMPPYEYRGTELSGESHRPAQ